MRRMVELFPPYFFTPLTVKYPTYDVYTCYMHESRYKLNGVYQI